jgi:hypothetical protein
MSRLVACICPPRSPTTPFVPCPLHTRCGEVHVPCALHALCGLRLDPTAVAALDVEVRQAIRQYRVEVACGARGAGPLRVRGRPLSDYLALDTLGRLITTRFTLAEDVADG